MCLCGRDEWCDACTPGQISRGPVNIASTFFDRETHDRISEGVKEMLLGLKDTPVTRQKKVLDGLRQNLVQLEELRARMHFLLQEIEELTERKDP